MIRPPASGFHAHHRPLGTPGPTGVNDHGDPGHVRREGPAPGPLGWNDHARPLPTRWPLMLDPEYQSAMHHPINEVIARVDANSAAASLQEKLKLCAAAVATMNSEGSARSPGALNRCMQAYFFARHQAFAGGLEVGNPAAPACPETKAPATEPRVTGEYLRSVGRELAPEASPRLSYHRAMRSTNDGVFRVERDPVRFWVDKGWADGLRDRSANDGRLRSYGMSR